MLRLLWAVVACLSLGVVGCTGLGELASEEDRPRDPHPPTFLAPVAVFGSQGSGPGQFAEPRQLAFDSQGNLYVADFRNYRVQVFNAAHQYVRSWGEKGNGPGEFNDPCGIAVAPNGDVIVADTWNNRAQVFTSDGTFKYQIGGMVAPRGVEVDPSGQILVTDSLNCKIRVFDGTGRQVREWGECGLRPRQFVEPVGIVMDALGNLLVCDNDNSRIQIFDIMGGFKGELKIPIWPKKGWREPYIDTLPDGTFVYTAPEYNKFVRTRIDGTILGSYGGDGGEPGKFMRPTGIAVSPSGQTYVMDSWNHRIQVFDLR